MGFGKFIRRIAAPVVRFLGGNPLISLGVSLFLAWALRPKVPEIEDFGTNEFDDFERGILLNKQSNDANIPVIYGERLVGGTRVFMETSGTDNTYLYMAIILSEGEITDINEIYVNDNLVTWSGDLADNTQVTVNASDSNYDASDSTIRVLRGGGWPDYSSALRATNRLNYGSPSDQYSYDGVRFARTIP